MYSIRVESVCILGLICIAGLAGQGFADSYSGSLSWTSDENTTGLIATENWASVNTSLSWTVTYLPASYMWHYEYILNVTKKDISHIHRR